MKVYHATPKKNGDLILNDRKLKSRDVNRHFNNKLNPTTDGYVYFGTLDKALNYGNIVAVQTKDEYLYVFEIDLPEELLQVDIDEVKYTILPWKNMYKDCFVDLENPTFEECWETCKTTRIKGDICFDEYNTKLAILESSLKTESEKSKKMMKVIKLCNQPLSESNEKVMEYCESLDWRMV